MVITMSNNNKISTGNALVEGQDRRGWYVGAFIEPEGALQHNADVEIKWGIHPKDEQRSSKAGEGNATTMSVLIRGKFGITFKDQEEIVLEKEGDYAIWNPNIPHETIAYDNSVILTVRWPSLSAAKN